MLLNVPLASSNLFPFKLASRLGLVRIMVTPVLVLLFDTTYIFNLDRALCVNCGRCLENGESADEGLQRVRNGVGGGLIRCGLGDSLLISGRMVQSLNFSRILDETEFLFAGYHRSIRRGGGIPQLSSM